MADMKPWRFQPAKDLGLAPRGRLQSLQRETGLLAFAGRLAWRGLVRAYLGGAHSLRVDGRENLPADGPFVMIGNHASHLDALVLAACVPGRLAGRIFPLAAGDTFFTSAATSAFAATALNALPIWRGQTRPEHLEALRARLVEDACVYILFPEGTRTRDGRVAAFKTGIGRLVAGTPVPVVPCWIAGAHACFPPSARLPRPGPIRVRIGPPLRFDGLADDKPGWGTVAQAAEAAVRALGEP